SRCRRSGASGEPREGGDMSNRRSRLVICCLLAVTGVAFGPRRAAATQKWGPVQLSGNLQTQNLIRHPNESTFEFIQNRNTAHIRLDYDWLQGGVFYNKYNIPFLESSHLFMLWRGVYDSIYDTTPAASRSSGARATTSACSTA